VKHYRIFLAIWKEEAMGAEPKSKKDLSKLVDAFAKIEVQFVKFLCVDPFLWC